MKIWWVSRLWNAVRNKVDKVLEGTKDNKGKGTGIYLTLRSISSCKLLPKLFFPAQSMLMKQIQQINAPTYQPLTISSNSMHLSGSMLISRLLARDLASRHNHWLQKRTLLAAARSPTNNKFSVPGPSQYLCRKRSKCSILH